MAAVRARVGGVGAAIIWALPAGNRDKVIRPHLFPYRSRAIRLIGGREHEQAADDRVDPPQLIERDVELGRLRERGPE